MHLHSKSVASTCSYILAWPWARVGVTDTPAYDAETLGAYRQPSPWLAAGLGLVDDVRGLIGSDNRWIINGINLRTQAETPRVSPDGSVACREGPVSSSVW